MTLWHSGDLVEQGAPEVGSDGVDAGDAKAAPRRRRTRESYGWLQATLGNKKALIGIGILVVLVVAAVGAPVLAPGDPSRIAGPVSVGPSLAHLFGTTNQGQDVFALTVWGARSSLAIGFAVGALAALIGGAVGLAGAYFGRFVDEVLSALTNIFLLLPGIPLLIILSAFLPPSAGTIVVVLVVTGWAGSARVLRSQALSIRGKEYIDAAVVTGERPAYVMLREILPNMASVVMSTFLSCVIFGITAQAALEFLGLGDVSAVSWGTNLFWADNSGALLTGAWWTFVPAGGCIALVAFALALTNYAVDEVTNPRLRRSSKQGRAGAGRVVVKAADRLTEGDRKAHPVLSVRSLEIDYLGGGSGSAAVRGVTFNIAAGEFFGLAGESGSGKTSVAMALLNLLDLKKVRVAGDVRFRGEEVLGLEAEALKRLRWREIAAVFQSAMNSLNPVMTIGDQIADVFTTHEGMRLREARMRSGELLELVGIRKDRVAAYPHQLSGGMRQRVGICMALALHPSLLIMDEPTTALDVVVQKEIIDEIRKLQAQLGFAVLFITHDLGLMVEVSDRIAVMRNGLIVEEGPAASVFESPSHPYTRQLVEAFPSAHGSGRMSGRANGKSKSGTERDAGVMDGPPRLVVRGLSKEFHRGFGRSHTQVRAVDGVEFDVRRAEILALVGQSGCGKTTIGRILARLERPTSGEIELDGQAVLQSERRGASRAYRRRVQLVFQDPFGSLNPAYKVRHFLARPLKIYRLVSNRNELDKRVAELLGAVGLEQEVLDRYPHQLSGGQRQRVAFARAVAVEPEVIVADEPTSMVDVSIRLGLLALMQKLRDERGISFIYVTHDLASARFVADNAVVMLKGRFVEGGTCADIMDHPVHPYTRLLLSALPDPSRRVVDKRRETSGVGLGEVLQNQSWDGEETDGGVRAERSWLSATHWVSQWSAVGATVDGPVDRVTGVGQG